MRFKLWCLLIVHFCKFSLNGINVHGWHHCKFTVAGFAILDSSHDLLLPISKLSDQLFFLFNGRRVLQGEAWHLGSDFDQRRIYHCVFLTCSWYNYLSKRWYVTAFYCWFFGLWLRLGWLAVNRDVANLRLGLMRVKLYWLADAGEHVICFWIDRQGINLYLVRQSCLLLKSFFDFAVKFEETWRSWRFLSCVTAEF